MPMYKFDFILVNLDTTEITTAMHHLYRHQMHVQTQMHES